jgi:homoaconitase/3-isopropylmalate dehydratase large subunit
VYQWCGFKSCIGKNFVQAFVFSLFFNQTRARYNQGKFDVAGGSFTHLVSPAIAAASAIAGHFSKVK